MQINADFLDMLLIAMLDSDTTYPIRCYSCGEDIEADTDGGTEAGDADRLMAALSVCGSHVHGSERCAHDNLDLSPAASLSDRGQRRREDASLAARVAARLWPADGSSREWARQIADGELREAAFMLADWRVPKSARHTAKGQLEHKRSSNHLWSRFDAVEAGIAEARREAREADAGAEAGADFEARRAVLAAPRVQAPLDGYAAAHGDVLDARDDSEAASATRAIRLLLGERRDSETAGAAREARAEAVREAWTSASETLAIG